MYYTHISMLFYSRKQINEKSLKLMTHKIGGSNMFVTTNYWNIVKKKGFLIPWRLERDPLLSAEAQMHFVQQNRKKLEHPRESLDLNWLKCCGTTFNRTRMLENHPTGLNLKKLCKDERGKTGNVWQLLPLRRAQRVHGFGRHLYFHILWQQIGLDDVFPLIL